MAIIKNHLLSNVSRQAKFTKLEWIDTETILKNATILQNRHGRLSLFHSIYLDIIKDIQINLLEKIKNNQFDEPFFIAITTSNFVQEIMNDLENPSKSQINKQITKLKLQNPSNETKVLESKLDMHILYDFIVNHMANLEDNLRAIAMAKAGKSSFTQKDKNQILDTIITEIYRHSKTPNFSKNIFGTLMKKMFEGIVKIGMANIGSRHLNKSISISKVLLQH